jgi:hypothetical protein
MDEWKMRWLCKVVEEWGEGEGEGEVKESEEGK